MLREGGRGKEIERREEGRRGNIALMGGWIVRVRSE